MKRIDVLRTILSVSLICTAVAFAGGEKERMAQRRGEIRSLKSAGIIGERADGLLGFVKKNPADQALVDAENKDRKAVYAEIAKGQGISVSEVANARGQANAKRSASGDWLQNTKRKWVQKK